MDITAKELRISPGKILEKVSRGAEVFVTYRGKRMAKIVPADNAVNTGVSEPDEIFGLWKDHERGNTVDDEINKIRKGRTF
ncbi:MAG TPA: type II toxin-antitoxin system prevent-host-death family antitoxin [Spirochaetota bacterium]|nr:type II toxin-antitoxin system prevent-host-death family antitoxin [Spirochaetota bacterium]